MPSAPAFAECDAKSPGVPVTAAPVHTGGGPGPGLALRWGSPAVPPSRKEACSYRRSILVGKKRQAAITCESPGGRRGMRAVSPSRQKGD